MAADAVNPKVWAVFRRPLIGYVILVVAVSLAFFKFGSVQHTICVEEHARYDTEKALVFASTRPTEIAKARLPEPQYREYKKNLASLRGRLLLSLAAEPSC